MSAEKDLLVAFKTWETDNDIKNLTPEQLADFYLEETNQPKDGLREAAEKVVIIYNNGYRHALRRPMEELEKALK